MDPVKRDTLIADMYEQGVRPQAIVAILNKAGIHVSLSAVERVIRVRNLPPR